MGSSHKNLSAELVMEEELMFFSNQNTPQISIRAECKKHEDELYGITLFAFQMVSRSTFWP